MPGRGIFGMFHDVTSKCLTARRELKIKVFCRPIGAGDGYYLMIINRPESRESMGGGGAPERRVQGGAVWTVCVARHCACCCCADQLNAWLRFQFDKQEGKPCWLASVQKTPREASAAIPFDRLWDADHDTLLWRVNGYNNANICVRYGLVCFYINAYVLVDIKDLFCWRINE